MHCVSCGFENQPESQFCEECGTKLVRACPSCGREALAMVEKNEERFYEAEL